MRQAVGPFDGEYAVGHAEFVQAEIISGRSIESIEVDMVERQSSTAVLVDDRERRTADFVFFYSKSSSQAAYERCLPCSKLPRQQQDIAGRQ